jgi:hypothetical protein
LSSAEPVQRARELAQESRFLSLCRIGFLGRGILYILIAALVLRSGRTEDLTGVFEYLNRGIGRFLLTAIAAGMIAYGLWRLADAVWGIDSGGYSNRAKARRIGAAGIGIVYLYLAYKAVRILLAGRLGNLSPQDEAAVVLDMPGGPIMLGAIAIGLIAGGLGQLWFAKTCRFLLPLDGRAVSGMVRWLGRFGYAARGVVFIAIGFLLGGAAIDGSSTEAGGLEQALDLFSGPILAVIAAGLLLFGIFSIIEALYRHIPEPPSVDEIKSELAEKLS